MKKKIYKVDVAMNTIGEMLIVTKYVENSKIVTEIEPFSEEKLLKYKIQYEKQMAKNAKILNKTKLKTKTEKIEVNTEPFVRGIIEHSEFIIEVAVFAAIAYFAFHGASKLLDDFRNMESPIIPEEQIEYQDPDYNIGGIDVETRHK